VGLSLLEARRGERILEIGFGTGTSVVALAEAVGESGHVFGVDISPGMKAVAEARSGRRDQPHAPLQNATVDAVFMAFTLELFPNDTIPLVLSEVRPTLRPGGRLSVVSMAHDPAEPSRPERIYGWIHGIFPTSSTVGRLMSSGSQTDTGFVIARVERLEVWGLPVTAILAY
jgi:demethylmenaquinone methyltransferase/2-methoxy-6-polyprenyl-1,4-benzoquinol methylase